MKAVSKKTIAILEGFIGAKLYRSDKVIASYEIIDKGDDGRRLKIKFTDGETKEYYKHIWKHVSRNGYYDTLDYETLPKVTKCGLFFSKNGHYGPYATESQDLIIDPESIKFTRKEYEKLMDDKKVNSIIRRKNNAISRAERTVHALERRINHYEDQIRYYANNANAVDARASLGCYIPNSVSHDFNELNLMNEIKSFYKHAQILDE